MIHLEAGDGTDLFDPFNTESFDIHEIKRLIRYENFVIFEGDAKHWLVFDVNTKLRIPTIDTELEILLVYVSSKQQLKPEYILWDRKIGNLKFSCNELLSIKLAQMPSFATSCPESKQVAIILEAEVLIFDTETGCKLSITPLMHGLREVTEVQFCQEDALVLFDECDSKITYCIKEQMSTVWLAKLCGQVKLTDDYVSLNSFITPESLTGKLVKSFDREHKCDVESCCGKGEVTRTSESPHTFRVDCCHISKRIYGVIFQNQHFIRFVGCKHEIIQ